MEYAASLIISVTGSVLQTYGWLLALVLGTEAVTMMALHRFSWKLLAGTSAAFLAGALVFATLLSSHVS